MTKKGLLRKSAALATLALSGVMCFTVTSQSLSASAASDTALFKSEYSSREEVLKATLDLSDRLAEEGMVLVKNENDALPLLNTRPRVSVFGYASVKPTVGASNSNGGDTSAGEARVDADLYTSLADAGFVVNPATKEFYESKTASSGGSNQGGFGSGSSSVTDATLMGTSWDTTFKGIESTYHSYSDAAIVMLANTAGAVEHTRQFGEEQQKLVEYLGNKFDKVILLINNSYPFELGWAQDAKYVDAILIVGQPGNTGFNAVGKILNGEVNPSGHLADLYATDFTVTPSYINYNHASDYTGMVHYMDHEGNNLAPTGSTYVTQYEEGIYVGYRYYETMATLSGITVDESNAVDGETWYKDHVVYPFGYGLSYTTFEYSDVKISGTVSANGNVTATLKVTNTGDVAGKDVVQLYYSAPWDENTVEKSAVVLGDYTKTKLLQPGQSQKISISISAADMASYDYNLDNGKGGYILDEGDYVISLRSDSHTVLTDVDGHEAKETLSLLEDVTSGINLDTNGEDVHNQFSDVTAVVTGDEENLAFDSALSRKTMAEETVTSLFDDTNVVETGTKSVFVPGQRGAAGKMQEVDDIHYLKLTEAQEEAWKEGMRMRADEDDPLYEKWAVSDGEGGYILNGNGPADPDERDETAKVTASDLIGKAYDDELWDELLNELSIEELHQLFREGGYGTAGIEYIGLPSSFNMDGPYGWTGNSSSWDGKTLGNETFPLFCSEVMVACTFNKELAYEEGKLIGEQGLWGNDTNGASNTWTGYYSPALNIHRSPFDSRGTEYYSEDPVLSGYMAANVARGAQEKGTFVTLKHFAVYNDGNSPVRAAKGTPDPTGFSVWLDEQTLREVYLKGFEIAVKTGGATGVMTSFARIGYTYCGVNYALCTEVLRNEWGFKGIVVSDICFYANQDGTLMALAGNNLALTKAPQTWVYYEEGDQAVKNGSAEVGQLNAESGGGVINVLWEKINAGECESETEAFNLYLEENAKAATAIYNALREGAHGIIYTIVNSNAMQAPYSAYVDGTASSGSTDNGDVLDAIGGLEDKLDDLNDKVDGIGSDSGSTDNGDVLDAIDGLGDKLDGLTTDNSDVLDAIGGLEDKLDGLTTGNGDTVTTSNGDSTVATVGMVFGILAFVASGVAVILIILKNKKKD